MKRHALLFILPLVIGASLVAAPQTPGALDTAAIDKAFGMTGQLQGDVYRISMLTTIMC